MIAQERITEIRSRASIVAVVSQYVALEKSGGNYIGLCPFHHDIDKSFTVSEGKGIYHCSDCHAGGSIFHFLMQHDELTFAEAVERVAAIIGLNDSK